MATERLSKLQKWILSETYKFNILHDGTVIGKNHSSYYIWNMRGDLKCFGKDLSYCYFENWIYQNYYGFHIWYGDRLSYSAEYNKAHATICRTVRNMEEKGLIDITRYYSNSMKNWELTTKGIEAIKMFEPELIAEPCNLDEIRATNEHLNRVRYNQPKLTTK
jgi:hypothetical protein